MHFLLLSVKLLILQLFVTFDIPSRVRKTGKNCVSIDGNLTVRRPESSVAKAHLPVGLLMCMDLVSYRYINLVLDINEYTTGAIVLY